MTREEAKAKLLAGELLYCEEMTYTEFESYCWTTRDWLHFGEGFECCWNTHANVEEVLNDIEHKCKGDWSEVS